MKQTKKSSMLEVLLNQGSGFIIAYLVWKYILAVLIKEGYLTVESSMIITIIFTVISVIRGYFFRRIFNYYLHKDQKMECTICGKDKEQVGGSNAETGFVCQTCIDKITKNSD